MSNNTSSKIAVSVIIPITENENYLARCLESILAQSLRNIEIILVHTSSDGPSLLCAKYANNDGRIKIINKNGVGYGVAFNAGLAEATGEYIAFVDSCDWLEPEMYEVLYEIAADQNVDITHCLTYENRAARDKHVSNPFANVFNKYVRYINVKNDYKFFLPMLLFYSENLYSTIYRKRFLTDNQIKFSEIPGSNAQNLGFTFLVFAYLGSFYIHEAPLYHLNIKRSYFTDKSFTTAIESIGEYSYIKKQIEQRGLEDKYIGKRYLHIAMAKIFRHIRHRYFIHCQTISQKREFLRSVESLLKDYYPLKNDNMFLNGKEKRLYKRFIRHPIKTSIKYTLNGAVKKLGKKLLTDISFTSKKKQIKVFGFRIFFYKKIAGYYTFNLLQVPIYRRKTLNNIEENSLITHFYFLGLLYAKEIQKNDRTRSQWLTNRRKYNPIYRFLATPVQLGIHNRILKEHESIFFNFKNINSDKNVKIFGNGVILNDAISVAEGKVIACNKNLSIFDKKPDYIFASDYIDSNEYYNKLILNKGTSVFIDFLNSNKLILASKSVQASQIEDFRIYYGNWSFYDDICQDIETAPLAFFGDTVHSALHFALYTNPKAIYLIGCDIYDSGVHKNNRQFAATAQELAIGYKKLKKFRDSYYPNTKIICVNPLGLSGIFEDLYTNDFLRSCHEVK